MDYTKQNFIKGQVLKADHLNYMEDGIATLSEEMDALKEGGIGGETVEKTGAVVMMGCDSSMEIEVSGDAAGSVEIVHQGKNFIPGA